MYATAPQLKQRAAPDEGDAALLRRFARDGDQPSFAAVVRRHSGLVRGCAGRRVDDASLADDVAQAAFIVLARRPRQAARAAAACGTAGPWLLRAVSYAAGNALKSRRRRDHHERRAAAMTDPIDAGGDPSHVLAWREVRPILDDCLLRLNRQDQAAVSLRHLEGHGIAEVAEALSITPDAAKQRVSRATRRLRDLLERRGVTVPAATLAAVLAARAAVPAFKPDAAALLTATAGTGPHLIANGALTLMTLAKLKVAAGLCAGGLAVTAAVVAVAQPGGGGTAENPGGFRVGPVPVVAAAQVESMPDPAAEAPPAEGLSGGGFGRSRPATRPAGDAGADDAADGLVIQAPGDVARRRYPAEVLAHTVRNYVAGNRRLPRGPDDLGPYLPTSHAVFHPGDYEFAAYEHEVTTSAGIPAAFERPADDEAAGRFVIMPSGEAIYVTNEGRLTDLRKLAGLEPGLVEAEGLKYGMVVLLMDVKTAERERGRPTASLDSVQVSPAYGLGDPERVSDRFDFRPPGVPLAEADPRTPVLFLRDRGDLPKLPVGYAGGEVEVLSRDEEAAERERAAEAAPAPATRPAEVDDADLDRSARSDRAQATLDALADYHAANGRFPRDLAEAAPYYEGPGDALPADAFDYREPRDTAARVGTGDVLRVSIADFPLQGGLFTDAFRVTDAGNVRLPDVNQVDVAGLTEADAAAAIAQAFVDAGIMAPGARVSVIVAESAAGAGGRPTPGKLAADADFSPPVILERESAAGDDAGRFVGRFSGRVHYVVDPRTLAELDREMASPPSTRPAGE